MPRRSPDPRPKRRLGARLALVVLAVAGALALAVADRPGSDHPSLSVLRAAGTLSHDNSRDGSAILSASGVSPGWSGTGRDDHEHRHGGAWLRLTGVSPSDTPGPGGGKLSTRMLLVVEDATDAGFAVPVYSGTLDGVGQLWLGRMEPGEARVYRFSTTMPSGPDDNAYQSAAVTARFDWALSDTDPDAEPSDGGGGGGAAAAAAAGGGGGGEPEPVDPGSGGDPGSGDGGEPPVVEPPDDVDVVPDGKPVVKVRRGQLRVSLAIPSAQRPLKSRSLIAYAHLLATLSGDARRQPRPDEGRLERPADERRLARVRRRSQAARQAPHPPADAQADPARDRARPHGPRPGPDRRARQQRAARPRQPADQARAREAAIGAMEMRKPTPISSASNPVPSGPVSATPRQRQATLGCRAAASPERQDLRPGWAWPRRRRSRPGPARPGSRSRRQAPPARAPALAPRATQPARHRGRAPAP